LRESKDTAAELTKDRSSELSAFQTAVCGLGEGYLPRHDHRADGRIHSLPTSGFSPLVSLFSQVVSHHRQWKGWAIWNRLLALRGSDPFTRKLVAGFYRRRQQRCIVPRFDPVLAHASNPHSSHVSYLAQTRKSAPVIIYFPEGVESHDR